LACGHGFVLTDAIGTAEVGYGGDLEKESAIIDQFDVAGAKARIGYDVVHDVLIEFALKGGDVGMVKFDGTKYAQTIPSHRTSYHLQLRSTTHSEQNNQHTVPNCHPQRYHCTGTPRLHSFPQQVE
jgi:hypothetical protein